MCVCMCVRACVSVCVRACVHACVRAYVRMLFVVCDYFCILIKEKTPYSTKKGCNLSHRNYVSFLFFFCV